MIEESVLVEITQKLNLLKVPYVLTGGLAVSYYGGSNPEGEGDVVIALEHREGLPNKLMGIFSKDYQVSQVGGIDAMLNRAIFHIDHSQSGMQVDCWIMKTDRYPQSILKRRKRAKIGKHKFYIISPEDLILTTLEWYKRSWSEKHVEDAQRVIRGQRGVLDMAHMRKWGPKLSLSEYLNALM